RFNNSITFVVLNFYAYEILTPPASRRPPHPPLSGARRRLQIYLLPFQFVNMRSMTRAATRTQQWLRLIKEAIKGEEKVYTAGSINRALVLLAIPMILEMSMESLFALVDAYFVGGLGKAAVATVGLTESVLSLIYAVAIGISMAATAIVARRIGEKDPEGAAHAAVQALYLAMGFSALVSILGVVFSREILALMGADAVMIENGHVYTKIALG